jgi:serine/threonine protein kinase
LASSETGLTQSGLGPGDRIEHYEVVEYIGGGGMARVFRALDTRLARTVALKVLSREQAADEDTRLRFLNEAQSTAQLDHENIARVYFVGEDRGLPFIAFEYIEGKDIRALVERHGPLGLAEAVSYTLQVAEALAHAASRNVVHRDIKPSNILITPEGRAKLIDLGLARIQKTTGSGDLTASGVTLGTFDYISPEQARDPRNADVRSDIYSLGCAFFFMLVGRPPFPEGTVLQKLLQHQGDEPPDLRQWRPDLPDEVIRILRKMLAKDPQRRYQDATELVEDLLALAELAGLRISGPGRMVWVPPREPRVSFLEKHLPWIAPIAALVCIVMLLDRLWSPSAGPDDGLPSAVVEQPAGVSGVAPLPAEPVVGPRGSAKGVEEGPGQPGEPPRGTVASTGSAPPAQPAGKPASPSGAGETVAKPDGGPRPAAQPDAETWLNADSSNPLKMLAASTAESEGLRADPFQGRVAGGDPTAAGLTAVRLVPDSSQAGGAPVPRAGPAAPRRDDRTGVLVVSQRGEGPNEFATLAAACSAATSGDVIELRYNGRRDEIPIRLTNLHVTIRAGEGFHPEIAFRPSPQDKDPVGYSRSMIALSGGELALFDVALVLDVPREVAAESWSLFEPGQSAALRLKKCLLTIRNASDQQTAFHPDAAFFRAMCPPGADAVIADESSTRTPPVSIELTDCVARGEATLLRAEDSRPIRLVWENGLLATSERLLVVDGGQRSPLAGEKIQLDLRHLTAAVRGGLCRLASGEVAPHQLETEIHCKDSILLGPAKGFLIEQSGLESVAILKQRVRWNGEWNFYEGFTVPWSIRTNSPDSPPELLAQDAWQSHWGPEREALPKWGQVVWKRLPEAGRAASGQTPADYALGEVANNPARRAARDGRDVGFQAELLPAISAIPPVAKPAGTEGADVSK